MLKCGLQEEDARKQLYNNKLQILMFDFGQLGQQLNPVIKKVQLDLINKLQDDDSTRKCGEAKNEKQKQQQLPQTQTINFMSLRQRYNGLVQSDNFPLPRKFDNLLVTMRNIEQNFWKKKRGLAFDFKKHCLEILQIGQLLKLDKELYEINQTEKGIELRIAITTSENLPQFQQFQMQLPNQLELRIKRIRTKLDQHVQLAHTLFLEQNKIDDFEEFSRKYKVYHPDFDLQTVNNIQPITLQNKIFQKEEQEKYHNLIIQIIKYYHLRGVSFMFFPNLIDQLHLRIEMSKDEIEQKLIVITKCLPDFIQISNKHKELIKQKWIVQVNRNCKQEDIIEIMSIYFF